MTKVYISGYGQGPSYQPSGHFRRSSTFSRCSDPSAKRSRNSLKKKTLFTEQQKATLNQAFAVSRIPEEAIIASLVSELQLSRTQLTPCYIITMEEIIFFQKVGLTGNTGFHNTFPSEDDIEYTIRPVYEIIRTPISTEDIKKDVTDVLKKYVSLFKI
ncbi:hypothetical protein B9Z55_027581 [Caenorhabditis nigoni]|uniref:Homeobox domain-containing protein n=1 Tax=Caenorhabditis nigoni TaxID=1611254 RepID=A0A2G5SFA5_9PELO|nr:hypothetical protein B9Z55_027581 [Caenorhabditis nigoni]